MGGMKDLKVKKHRASVTPSEQRLTDQGHSELLLINKIYSRQVNTVTSLKSKQCIPMDALHQKSKKYLIIM